MKVVEALEPDYLPATRFSISEIGARPDIQHSIRSGWEMWATDPEVLAAAVPAFPAEPDSRLLQEINEEEQQGFLDWAISGHDLAAMAEACRQALWDAIAASDENSQAGVAAKAMLTEASALPTERTCILAATEVARLLIAEIGRTAAYPFCDGLYGKMLVPAKLVALAVSEVPAVEINNRVYLI